MNNEAIKYQQEDEIDLKELWKTLMKRKWFIVIFTSIVTILAIIFSLVKTPIYEATALIEIGIIALVMAESNLVMHRNWQTN